MTPHTDSTLTAYDAARTGAAVVRVPGAGYLRFAGQDRIEFIQRQTTNDARALTPGHTQLTVLTSATARTLDVWRLVPEGEQIGVITLPGRGASTAQYLQRRIFFMDKVTVTDTSAEIAQIVVFGPEAAAVLGGIGLDGSLDPGAVMTVGSGGLLHVVALDGVVGRGVLLLVETGAADAVIERLTAAGGVSVPPETAEVYRVEAGLPGPAGELTEDYTPLETGLDAAVSSTKGCYTGQEVIARQITYDKVTRRLVRLRLGAAVPVGVTVQVEGRGAGTITSAVESPRLGPLALAVLRRPHDLPGVVVSVVLDGGLSVPGVTVAEFEGPHPRPLSHVP